MAKKLIFMMLIMASWAIKVAAQQSSALENTRVMKAVKATVYNTEKGAMQDISGTDFLITEKDISEASTQVTCTYREGNEIKRLFGPALIHLTDYSFDDKGHIVKLEFEGIIVADSNGTTHDISYTVEGGVISFIDYDTEFCCALIGIEIITGSE